MYDAKLSRFGVRVAPGGAKSWIIEYRPGGGRRSHTRRYTLGSVEKLTPERARSEAKDKLAAAQLGKDPAAEKAAQRAAATVFELATEFMRNEVRPTRKPRTADLYDMYLNRHVLPTIGGKKARDVTLADIRRLHRAIGADAQVTANRVVMLVRGLYTWAEGEGKIPAGHANPAKGVSLYAESEKDRFLTADELSRLGDTLRLAETEGLPWQVKAAGPQAKHVPKARRRTVVSPIATAAIRFLLFTGLRLREVLGLRWDHVEIEAGRLLLPDSKTGRRYVVLGAPALAVLAGLPRLGACVFPGNDGDSPRHDLHRPWAAVTQHAGLEGVRLHDLRHSFGSVGATSGVGMTVVGKLLGHRQVSTTKRYSGVAEEALRQASTQIGNTLADALAPRAAQK